MLSLILGWSVDRIKKKKNKTKKLKKKDSQEVLE